MKPYDGKDCPLTDAVWWLVKAPLNTFLVEAGTVVQARDKARKDLGFEHKPWISRDWEIRVATEDDKALYAAFAEAHRKSEPTLKTAKRKTKPARDRLFGGDKT